MIVSTDSHGYSHGFTRIARIARIARTVGKISIKNYQNRGTDLRFGLLPDNFSQPS